MKVVSIGKWKEACGMNLYRLLILVVYIGQLVSAKFNLNNAPTTSKQGIQPFEHIGQCISRFGKNTQLDSYPVEEITCALSTLARSQSALKSMDGITHQFRNVIKER